MLLPGAVLENRPDLGLEQLEKLCSREEDSVQGTRWKMIRGAPILTQRSRSGLIMPLSRHSVETE